MIGEKKLAIVVPAHNEERLIKQTISSIPDYADHIIVVDDASEDRTKQTLATIRDDRLITILHHENRGVGGTIVTGYKKAIAMGINYVAVMAGDAQMDPADLPFLIEPLLKGRCDYVKGDRLSWPGVFRQMPILRFIGNHILSKLTRISSGFNSIRDSQCGYTIASGELLSRIDLDALWPRYGFPNDMLAKIHAAGGRVENVPVRPIYGDEISGISLTTALFRVPLVLIRSLVWRLKRERRLPSTVESGPVKSLDV